MVPCRTCPAATWRLGRELFLNLGGFDETIVTSEDTEFCERAAASVVPVLAMPSLSVVHLGTPQTLEGFYRKQSWHGVNVHRVFLRDVLHSKSRKAMLFAVYMLAASRSHLPASARARFPVTPRRLWLVRRDPADGPDGAGSLLHGAQEVEPLLPLTVLYAAYGTWPARCACWVSVARASRAAPRRRTAYRPGDRTSRLTHN
jgi:hypothetical protein